MLLSSTVGDSEAILSAFVDATGWECCCSALLSPWISLYSMDYLHPLNKYLITDRK